MSHAFSSQGGSRTPRHLITLLAAAAALAMPREAAAWNKAGHMVHGAIAYRELAARDTAALRRTVALLRAHPEYESRWLPAIQRHGMEDHDIVLFMYAARWPDDIRDDPRYHQSAWHYTNIPFVPPGDRTRPPEGTGGDIVLEIGHNLAVVRDPLATEAAKAVALCWVFHLVGDLHQPLHAVTIFSTRWPEGDRGGNLFFVRARMDARPINLHSLWDGLIIGSENTRGTMNRATLLRAEHPSDRVTAQIEILDPERWAREEGYPLGVRWAYLDGTLKGGTARDNAIVLPASYLKDAQRIAEGQLTLAAYRLASLLSLSVRAGS